MKPANIHKYDIHNKVCNEAQGIATKRIKVRQPSPATAPKTDRATSESLNTSGGSFQNENNQTTQLQRHSKGWVWVKSTGKVVCLRWGSKDGFDVLWIYWNYFCNYLKHFKGRRERKREKRAKDGEEKLLRKKKREEREKVVKREIVREWEDKRKIGKRPF